MRPCISGGRRSRCLGLSLPFRTAGQPYTLEFWVWGEQRLRSGFSVQMGSTSRECARWGYGWCSPRSPAPAAPPHLPLFLPAPPPRRSSLPIGRGAGPGRGRRRGRGGGARAGRVRLRGAGSLPQPRAGRCSSEREPEPATPTGRGGGGGPAPGLHCCGGRGSAGCSAPLCSARAPRARSERRGGGGLR